MDGNLAGKPSMSIREYGASEPDIFAEGPLNSEALTAFRNRCKRVCNEHAIRIDAGC